MRRALIVCVLVAGCGGERFAGVPAPVAHTATQPPPSSVEVSLHGEDTRRVVWGHPLELEGVAPPSRPPAPATVHLLASRERVQTTTADSRGHFRFTVRPRINEIYS